MSDDSKVVVTMLGPTNSGKSTFLLGMYSILSGGDHGYFLHATDPDQDLDLSEAWDALIDDGILPPPTAEEFERQYDFVFKQGFTPVLEIDWLDYRGGAINDRTRSDGSDTTRLLARLDRSDAVYIVLNGAALVDGVDENNFPYVQRLTSAKRISVLLQQSIGRRQGQGREPPIIVVVVTKADLLVPPDDPENIKAVRERSVDDVKKLLPICFAPGVTTLICPVWLGHFGQAESSQVSPEDVTPKWLHKPIVFLFYYYLRPFVEGARAEAVSAQDRVAANERLYTASQGRLFGSARKAQLRMQLVRSIEEQGALNRALAASQGWLDHVQDQLNDFPVIHDGDTIYL